MNYDMNKTCITLMQEILDRQKQSDQQMTEKLLNLLDDYEALAKEYYGKEWYERFTFAIVNEAK